jgi:hypothetical protein
MAGVLSYMHIVILVNMSRLSAAVQHFCEKVTQLQTGYDKKEKYSVYLEKYGGRLNTEARVFFQISHFLDLMHKDADNLQSSINSLQASLPLVEEASSGPTQTHDLRIKRHPAVLIATTVLSGVFGMLMGWFTHCQLNSLCDHIGEVRNQQHPLLQIQQVTLTRLDELETILCEVNLEM